MLSAYTFVSLLFRIKCQNVKIVPISIQYKFKQFTIRIGPFPGRCAGAPKQDLEFGTFLKKAPQRQNLGLWD